MTRIFRITGDAPERLPRTHKQYTADQFGDWVGDFVAHTNENFQCRPDDAGHLEIRVGTKPGEEFLYVKWVLPERALGALATPEARHAHAPHPVATQPIVGAGPKSARIGVHAALKRCPAGVYDGEPVLDVPLLSIDRTPSRRGYRDDPWWSSDLEKLVGPHFIGRDEDESRWTDPAPWGGTDRKYLPDPQTFTRMFCGLPSVADMQAVAAASIERKAQEIAANEREAIKRRFAYQHVDTARKIVATLARADPATIPPGLQAAYRAAIQVNADLAMFRIKRRQNG